MVGSVWKFLLRSVTFSFFFFWKGFCQESDTFHYRKIQVTAFQPGEELVFRVHYGWFTAGTARFWIEKEMVTYRGRECYVIRGEGRSAKTFEWFYTVRDSFDSYVDAEGMFPHFYYRVINEGDFHYKDSVFYDHVKKTIKGKQGLFKMRHPYVQDMLSAFYYARCLPLREADVGDVFHIDVFMDDGIYDLGMKILGREVIKTDLGTFRCIKIAPLLVIGRVFKGEEDMIMWVTDDENLIPIRITSPVIVGSIDADLIKFKKLRYPLTSRIR
jgi:hypothetical protein